MTSDGVIHTDIERTETFSFTVNTSEHFQTAENYAAFLKTMFDIRSPMEQALWFGWKMWQTTPEGQEYVEAQELMKKNLTKTADGRIVTDEEYSMGEFKERLDPLHNVPVKSQKELLEKFTKPPETVLEHLQRLGVQVNFERDILHGTLMVVRAGDLRNAQEGRL